MEERIVCRGDPAGPLGESRNHLDRRVPEPEPHHCHIAGGQGSDERPVSQTERTRVHTCMSGWMWRKKGRRESYPHVAGLGSQWLKVPFAGKRNGLGWKG